MKKFKHLSILFIFFFTIFALEAKLPTYPYGEYPSDYWQFWFLYETETRVGQKEKIFRPFYSRYKETISNHQYTTSFYPLYYKQETSHWYKWTFLFIIEKDNMKHPDTGDDNDLVLTPLFQWGSGETEKDKYTAFFPFYGKMKSKLSWGEINFFLFPVYTDWQHKEFKAKSILYPLILWGNSDIRSELRIFPFYSKKTHTGKFEHYSVLWPFVQWGRDYMDKKEPFTYSFVFPFYARKESAYGNMRSYAFLWLPLLSSLVGYGYDRRTSEVNYNFLFFLFQYGYSNSQDYRKHMFIPFYGYSRFASKEFSFITPFYIHMRSDTYGVKSDYYYSIPFVYYFKKHFIKEDRVDTYFKIWPILRWHEDAEGSLYWNMLSLYPARSTTLERVWDPIWSIVEYKRQINGEKRLSFLMRLYSQRWTEDSFHMYLPFLLDLDLEKDKTDWKVLYGLFGYERENDLKKIKLFWFISL